MLNAPRANFSSRVRAYSAAGRFDVSSHRDPFWRGYPMRLSIPHSEAFHH
jgi:hypothetical protein